MQSRYLDLESLSQRIICFSFDVLKVPFMINTDKETVVSLLVSVFLNVQFSVFVLNLCLVSQHSEHIQIELHLYDILNRKRVNLSRTTFSKAKIFCNTHLFLIGQVQVVPQGVSKCFLNMLSSWWRISQPSRSCAKKTCSSMCSHKVAVSIHIFLLEAPVLQEPLRATSVVSLHDLCLAGHKINILVHQPLQQVDGKKKNEPAAKITPIKHKETEVCILRFLKQCFSILN